MLILCVCVFLKNIFHAVVFMQRLLTSVFFFRASIPFFYFFIFIFKLTVAKCISKRITFQNKHSKLSSVKHYFGQRIMEKLVTDPIFT